MSDASTPAVSEQTQWTDLCALADVPAQGGKFVALGRLALAVFRKSEDEVRAIDDTCPHAGGSLASGWVKDGCVYCPWHAWPFKIDDGKCPDSEAIHVRAYPTRIQEGKVQIQLPT